MHYLCDSINVMTKDERSKRRLQKLFRVVIYFTNSVDETKLSCKNSPLPSLPASHRPSPTDASPSIFRNLPLLSLYFIYKTPERSMILDSKREIYQSIIPNAECNFIHWLAWISKFRVKQNKFHIPIPQVLPSNLCVEFVINCFENISWCLLAFYR